MRNPKTTEWEWILDCTGELIPDTFSSKETVVDLTDDQVIQIDKKCRISKNPTFLKHWVEFISKFRDGDGFLHYNSSIDEWRKMNGSEGYAISREGFLVGSIIIRMN